MPAQFTPLTLARRRVLDHASSVPGTLFSPRLVHLRLAVGSGARPWLPLTSVLEVAQRLREAILSHCCDLPHRVQATLSGHDPDGGPLQIPHLAVLPLDLLGNPHPDGRLAGLALAFPAAISEGHRRLALRAARRVRRLVLGRLGVWNVLPAPARDEQAWTAHPQGAVHWSTVTPLVYDVHPKAPGEAASQREVAAMIARACRHVGLPAPREVIVTRVSAHLGAPPAHAFPRLRRKNGSQRQHTHVILAFDRPVRGPLLLGAGRYRGYGLLRPLLGPEGCLS